MLAVDTHPRVGVGTANDLIRDERHVLFADRIVELAPDKPLDREDGALGIRHRLPLGRLADEALAVVGERNDGRRGARALRIFDDLGGRTLHDSDARVGRAEIDANHFRHIIPLFLRGTARPQSGRALRKHSAAPIKPSASLFRSPFPNARFSLARFPRVRRGFAPGPASRGVYRWGDFAAQGAQAADSSSFEPRPAGRRAPSPFPRTLLEFANESAVLPPVVDPHRRGSRGE